MTNLIILSIALATGQREAKLTYYTPLPGRVTVDVKCAGDANWRNGAANHMAAAGTNLFHLANLCGSGGWYRLRWQAEGAKP